MKKLKINRASASAQQGAVPMHVIGQYNGCAHFKKPIVIGPQIGSPPNVGL